MFSAAIELLPRSLSQPTSRLAIPFRRVGAGRGTAIDDLSVPWPFPLASARIDEISAPMSNRGRVRSLLLRRRRRLRAGGPTTVAVGTTVDKCAQINAQYGAGPLVITGDLSGDLPDILSGSEVVIWDILKILRSDFLPGLRWMGKCFRHQRGHQTLR